MINKLLEDKTLYSKAKELIEKDFKNKNIDKLPDMYYRYEGAIEYIDKLLKENKSEDE